MFVLPVLLVAPVVVATTAEAAATAVPLGTTASFAILAGTGITNTGPTTVTGDIGSYPNPAITGSASMTVNGTNNGGNGVTQQAKSDLVTAYDNVAGQGPPTAIAADLGGLTLAPGVYNSASSVGLTGGLILNGQNNPNAIFVFQAGSTLTTASASTVTLINGAQACNVFWQVGSSATLGTGSYFLGTVLALTSITVTHGVTINGRVLARNGAVTLDNDTIARPTCTTGGGTGGTTGGDTGGTTTVPQLVQSATRTGSEVASAAASLTAPGTPGDLLIVEAETSETVPNTVTTLAVTNRTTDFTLRQRFTAPDGTDVTIWTLPVTDTTVPRVKVTPTSAPADIGFAVLEYSGLTGAIDGVSAGTGYTTGGVITSGAGVTAPAGDMVLGFEADSGWNVKLRPDPIAAYNPRVSVANNNVAELLIEDQVAAAAGTYSAASGITYTSATAGSVLSWALPGVPWVMATIAFKHA